MSKTVLHRELFDFDSEIRKENRIICGVDEAGRGPLAGDVYASAVVFEEGVLIDYLNDSKKLSEKRREELFDTVKEKALAYCIATASVEEIDRLNILGATMLAMKRAVDGLGVVPDLALVDGNRIPENMPCKVMCIVKGDSKSASIAGASVLAKVARDRYMCGLAAKYPEYGFERHKGYPTKFHYEMIEKHGVLDVHRKTFLKKILGDSDD